MRKEWYVLQAYSGMENKVKELLEEKYRMLGFAHFFGKIIVPEIEELDYSNKKVEKVFVNNDSKVFTKKGKDIKKGDVIAKEADFFAKENGIITSLKNFRRIIIETKGKKYSTTYLIPENAGILAGLRVGKDVKAGMPFTKDASFECEVDGEIGAIEKVKKVIIDNSLGEKDVYIVPRSNFDSKVFRNGTEISKGEKLAEGKEFKAKSSGRVDVRETAMRKEIRIIKTSRKKLFPGYIFIEMMHVKEAENLVKSIPYVSTFLNVGGKPIRLKRNEIRALLRLIGEEDYEDKKDKTEIRIDYEIGEHVKIINGPFEFFTGKIKNIDLDKHEVNVSVSMFGRETDVELGLSEIEKIVE
ncbi:KOW motif-containing protein [Oceanotoga sp. DSM 15011]|jgi:transcriptional antiterminator NusG|uniref:Transcription termination/antitermination protein NusG n=1 Tax=Oceanotoga teriensis TaxID=515440 RepID=A0AA45C5Z4_9BACT|nr:MULTISPECIES: transcription termination/antitermination NusG family protein [Oceanotoga]MDO7975686.1 KOW motif-containing protein [Oceanotoga teriensis]PWJ90565.1 transcription antitermination protein nusG [Oceanotoga teriensis]UYO99810.1 KOW motif-containing protein [Oceanotoga sp. DSM 15011]